MAADGDARRRSTVDADDVAHVPRAGRSSSPRWPSAPSVPGVATGLAVTGVGGDVLFIEATAMDGEPGPDRSPASSAT